LIRTQYSSFILLYSKSICEFHTIIIQVYINFILNNDSLTYKLNTKKLLKFYSTACLTAMLQQKFYKKKPKNDVFWSFYCTFEKTLMDIFIVITLYTGIMYIHHKHVLKFLVSQKLRVFWGTKFFRLKNVSLRMYQFLTIRVYYNNPLLGEYK